MIFYAKQLPLFVEASDTTSSIHEPIVIVHLELLVVLSLLVKTMNLK